MPESAISRPSGQDTLLMGIAVVAVSTSGPIIAAALAPALALAFWRCALGSIATAPWAFRRGFSSLRALSGADWRSTALAGGLLAAHFAAWIPSLRFTSVASSVALVATQPVWAALIARALGRSVRPGAWVGIGISLVGVVLLTGIDATLDPRSLLGDGLALLGAILAAAYVTAAAEGRRTMGTATFTTIIYAVAAVALLPVCLLGGVALWGFDSREWLLILALTAGPQLVGHTLINHVLLTTSATVVSLAILFELPGAVIIAALWLGDLPPVQVVPALVLLLAGLVAVIRTVDPPQPDPNIAVPPA